MVKEVIGIGNAPNDGTGDDLRTSFSKINNNFTELFNASTTTSNLDFSTNSLVSKDTNGQIILDPNGTGNIVLSADTSIVGTLSSTGNATFLNNVTISGNLVIDGTTTQIETVNLVVDDPLLALNASFTGASAIDSGFIIERGTNSNIGFIWDDSLGEFAAINTTEIGTTVGDVTISSYANLHVFTLTTEGVFSPISILTGDISISGGTVSNVVSNNDLNLTATGTGQVVLVSQLNMGSNAIRNVANPVTTADAMPQSFADSRYVLSSTTTFNSLTVDQITLNGLTISTNVTNANLEIDPNGTGDLVLVSGNLILNTGNITTTGNINVNNVTTTGTISGTLGSGGQPNITSLGTLTNLDVDNININLNTISSTAGTDLNITPLAGQQLVLDGTIIIDAGVITGATSITSTSFVGALTGNASTVTIADAGGDTTTFPLLGTAATGSLAPATDASLTYNATSGELSTTLLSGILTTAAQPNVTSLGTLTVLNVDNIVLNTNTISTATGNLLVTPNGISTIELQNDTNITANFTVTGNSVLTGNLTVTGASAISVLDQITIFGNTITSNVTNANIELNPAGTGTVEFRIGETTTVGAAGAGSALPATPEGYMRININGRAMKVPFYLE